MSQWSSTPLEVEVAFLGALIGGAATLIGGAMGARSSRKNNDANVRAQLDINRQNIAEARRAEKVGIRETRRAQRLQIREDNSKVRRLVEDARAAGIHPLAAMGVAGGGGFQAAQGVVPTLNAPVTEANTSAGDAVGAAGAMIGSAIDNRVSPLDQRMKLSQINLMDAQATDLLSQARSRSIIAAARAAGPRVLADAPTIRGASVPLTRDPNQFSSAGEVEEEYGGIAGEVFGLGSLATSVGRAIRNAYRDQVVVPYNPTGEGF